MKILKSNLAETNKQKRIEHSKTTATKRKNNNPVFAAKFDLMSEFSSGVDFSKSKMQKTSWTYDLFIISAIFDCGVRLYTNTLCTYVTRTLFNPLAFWVVKG